MNPSLAILLSGLLQAAIKLLERELSEDEKKEATEKGEQFASAFNNKDTETV